MVAQAPGQGNQGQGGSGSQQGQGSPTSTTTTLQTQSTTTTNPFAASTTSKAPTATSTSTATSSGVSKGVLIGGIVGGIGVLIVLAVLAICCLQRRKKRQLAAKQNTAETVSYSGLNSAFAGVPFRHSQNLSPQQTQSLLPGAAQHGSTHSSSGSAMRGGASSMQMTSSADTDLFLPTYAESQAANSVHSSPVVGHQLHTPQYSPIETNVSPLSTRAPVALHNISPQTTGGGYSIARDTMGFPLEEDFEMIRLTEPVPQTPVSIVAPIPRHPLVQQDSLERVVREGMGSSPSPAMSTLEPAVNPARLRVLSQNTPRESPILGNDPTHVRLLPQGTGSTSSGPMVMTGGGLGLGLGGGLSRNDTQRTVSTVSSMGPSVISDTELDRMGVGAPVNPTPKPGMYR
jgi:hypothetical protein